MPGIPYAFEGFTNNKKSCNLNGKPVEVDKEKNLFIVNGNTKLTRVCPHNGCLLDQKGDEFVCPCHRSKFDKCGNCLEGPACPNSIKIDS
jgi:Rieske Fe-S protein